MAPSLSTAFPPAAEGIILSPSLPGEELPSAQLEWVEEEEEEDVSPGQATIRVIQQQLQGRDEVQNSPSCAATVSLLPLVPSPPWRGGGCLVPENPSPPMGGDTVSLLSGTPMWESLSHTGQGVRSPQTLSKLQPLAVQGDTVFGSGRLSLSTPWKS
ncbi:hypothetical protein KIL84_004166 [Mauremys mutica]|uniref:Uncharacterized protein n=1 Tax=Mauremys mutica TaxID=74926 RepID=A0A9D3XL94_9SAUR|nr:hypothetical protein KIL84_004166 [Mauremys mutica]